MGSSVSSRARIRLTKDKCYHTDSNRNTFKLEAVALKKPEVNEILENAKYKSGTYLLYKDSDRDKTYLAFKTEDKNIAHYPIVKMNDLYYFNDFPFPYLESIVLYYKKYRFKGTKLTNQAKLDPYWRSQQPQIQSFSTPVDTAFQEPEQELNCSIISTRL